MDLRAFILSRHRHACTGARLPEYGWFFMSEKFWIRDGLFSRFSTNYMKNKLYEVAGMFFPTRSTAPTEINYKL